MVTKRIAILVGAITGLFMSTAELAAQQRPPAGGGQGDLFGFVTRAPLEFWLAFMLLLFGLLVTALLLFFLSRIQTRRPEDISAPVIVVAVIFGTLILATLGLRSEQLAAAFGLFGTIVGYILGRIERTSGK